MTDWSNKIGNSILKSVELQIVNTEYENDYSKPIMEYKPLLKNVFDHVKLIYSNNRKPICVRQYKKSEKEYKTKLYLFESHYIEKNQEEFVVKNIKEYRNYKFNRRELSADDTKHKLMSTFVNTDNVIDYEYNHYDTKNNRVYKLVYLRNTKLTLNTKYIPLYRAYKYNPNISIADCAKYYNDKEIDDEFPLIDTNGQAYKILGYQKNYNKKVGETKQTLDVIYGEWIDLWNELSCPKSVFMFDDF